MDKKSAPKNPENFDPEVQKALKELGININWKRGFDLSEFLYLLDRCPFLQIVDTNPHDEAALTPLKLITAKSGWKIHQYGDAMSSSPGLLLFGGGDFRINPDKKKDEEGGGIINPGKGTIINQAVVTALEMVELAHQLGWAGIKIVDGHQLMVWAAWMQAMDLGMDLTGYSPSAQDFVKRNRIKRPLSEQQQMYRPAP